MRSLRRTMRRPRVQVDLTEGQINRLLVILGDALANTTRVFYASELRLLADHLEAASRGMTYAEYVQFKAEHGWD